MLMIILWWWFKSDNRYPVCFPTPCAFFICFYFTERFSTHDSRDSIVSPELPSPNSVNLVMACVKVFFVKKGNVQPVSDILWLIKPAWVFSPVILRGLPSCLAEKKRTKHFIAVLVQECSRFKTTSIQNSSDYPGGFLCRTVGLNPDNAGRNTHFSL